MLGSTTLCEPSFCTAWLWRCRQLLPCPRGGITMVLALSEYEHGSGAMLMLDSG